MFRITRAHELSVLGLGYGEIQKWQNTSEHKAQRAEAWRDVYRQRLGMGDQGHTEGSSQMRGFVVTGRRWLETFSTETKIKMLGKSEREPSFDWIAAAPLQFKHQSFAMRPEEWWYDLSLVGNLNARGGGGQSRCHFGSCFVIPDLSESLSISSWLSEKYSCNSQTHEDFSSSV